VSVNSLLGLLERIPAIVWTTDLDSCVTALGGAGLRPLGISESDCAGKSIETLFPAADSDPGSLEAHRMAIEGHSGSFLAEVRGRDLEAHVEPLIGPGNCVIGTIGVAVDGAERAVTDLALRLSEQSYRLLVEEAPYAICRATASGQLLQANRAMMEMLSFEPGAEADLLECDLPLIFGSPAAFEDLRRTLAEGDTVQGLETSWRGRGGNEIQVRVGGRAVRDRGGRLLYLDILAENITERKQLEARLAQAQKMHAIGQLAGGVAHDFNNLLTVIGGQIEMVLAGALDEEIRLRLEDVRHASDRAAALTRQLLAFSRRQVLQVKIVDINRLIERLSGMLARLIRENIELVFLPGNDLGMVRADPNQIEQVLMNLAVNAQDAMPAGGKLIITTANVKIAARRGTAAVLRAEGQPGPPEPGEYILISVHDTGQGMDPETQARIFEPFFTTKKTGEGTGLGLAMAYGVVQQSGGHIQVESHSGEGSTFHVYLPRTGVAETEEAPPVRTAVVSPTGCETILLAEDERWVRKLVATHLEELGYRVLTASDGAEALEIARSHSGAIDLLLSDLIMPRVDGRQLAQQLRQIDPRLKVIFVSGYPGHGVAGNELEFPGARFLSKPVSMETLAHAVREVLDAVVK
jgi:two-component system, cell cycle sensor histidine kinase and response regulator CckA